MSTYESFPPARIETVPSPEQLTITYVDISDAVEKNAIDTAEAKLTADKEELKGFKGWCTKVFKFNLFYDLYRRQEIEKEKRKIVKSGNIYTGTGADIESTGRAKEQILQRFTSEYEEEMIQKNAGEWKEKAGDSEKEKTFRENIHALIQDFVSGAIDEAQLEEEKNRLLSNLTGVAQGDIRVRFADNVIQIARHMKAAHDHGAGCARLDMDIVRGKAVTGVRTEIQNKFDKTVDDFKKTRIGSLVGGLVNETTVSTAVVAVLSLSGAIAKSGAYMAARGLGAFAGTALLGGVLAWGRRRTQLEQERKQHAREMAQGKTFDKDKHERRKQVEEYRQKTVDAMTVVQELKTALYTSEGGREIARDLTEEEMKTAIGILAGIEARDRLSNEKKADLLSYSHVSRVEEERTALLIAKAKAKIELSRILKKYRPDESFDDVLNAAVDATKESLAGEMNERDKLFKTFKGKESLHAAFAGVMTGLAVGVATQEVLAFLRSDQSGLAESATKWLGEKLRAFGTAHAAPSAGISSPEAVLHNQTILNWLWHQGAQKFGWEHPPVLHEEIVRTAGKGMATLKLPEGLQSLHNPDGTVSIVQGTKHIVDNLRFNVAGQLTEESKKILTAQHIGAQEAVQHTTERVTEKVKHTVSEYIARHGDAFHRIKRLLWYNNDTPGIFDKNELKLWWGGVNGTGIDGKGNFVFNIRHMQPDGSYVKGFSVDAQDAMKRGTLKMLFSVSRDTQNMVVEVPIGPNGNAIIPQNSEIAHLLFKSVGGRAQFLGKFAEVAEVRGQKDGADLVRILATHVGKGLKETAGTIVKDIPHATPITTFDIPPVFELPPPIPIVGRRPLEPMLPRKKGERGEAYYYAYGGGGGLGLLDRSQYRERISPSLRENPELDVVTNDEKLVDDYLESLPDDYRKELEDLSKQITKSMDKKTKVVFCIPAYQEGKNIEKTLQAFLRQKNKENFEVVILENHPTDKERDNTGEVVRAFQDAHPELKIHLVYKTFPRAEAKIGNIRKYLNDLVLLRKQQAGHTESIIMVSNDADVEDISEEYVDHVISDFENNPKMDAAAAKWDYPEEAFKEMPLFHAAQRLWHFFDIVFRHKYLHSPELIGRNSMFRSGIYAAIGGYNPKAKLAEDLEIGWLIKNARGYNNPERIGYINTAEVISNPRRPIVKILEGVPIVEQYGDFHENSRIREYNWQQILAEKIREAGSDKVDFSLEDLSKEINALYRFYRRMTEGKGGWVSDRVFEHVFRRAMNFLGVSYKIETFREDRGIGERVVLLDTSKLDRGLNKEK